MGNGVTEGDWLAGRVRKMLQYARSRATMRQRRLLACGFCRIHWSQVPDARLKQFIELIERYADGTSGGNTLVRAYELFGVVKEPAVATALDPDLLKALRAAQASNEDPPGQAFPLWQDSNLQAALLREIFGNPFCPVALDAAWVTWKSGTVRRLAEAAYEQRNMPAGTLDDARLAVLADALEEAGCTEKDILGHLREASAVHVRGCWIVDLLTGRE
jgi:hypothetical protein